MNPQNRRPAVAGYHGERPSTAAPGASLRMRKSRSEKQSVGKPRGERRVRPECLGRVETKFDPRFSRLAIASSTFRRRHVGTTETVRSRVLSLRRHAEFRCDTRVFALTRTGGILP